jgi:hypothetical protein
MKSIFDGWKRKIDMNLLDGQGGFCARGWIRHHYGAPQAAWTPDQTNQVGAAEARIGRWIIANMDVPQVYREMPGAAIAWANNTHALDIEGFRMVDLLTQGHVPEPPEDLPEITEPEMPEQEQPAIGEPPEILEPAAA